MSSKCPKCGEKLSPFYLKEVCPKCGVNLLYYEFEGSLKADAEKAEREAAAVNHVLDIIKASTIASPLLIVRLVLFFTPLASMCLPMYNDISLIKLIIGIIKGTASIGDMIMPIVSMALVVVLSLAVIISSLFSATKSGFIRNMAFSAVNTIVFVSLGIVIGGMGIGWYITLAIYVLEVILHFVCRNIINEKQIVD